MRFAGKSSLVLVHSDKHIRRESSCLRATLNITLIAVAILSSGLAAKPTVAQGVFSTCTVGLGTVGVVEPVVLLNSPPFSLSLCNNVYIGQVAFTGSSVSPCTSTYFPTSSPGPLPSVEVTALQQPTTSYPGDVQSYGATLSIDVGGVSVGSYGFCVNLYTLSCAINGCFEGTLSQNFQVDVESVTSALLLDPIPGLVNGNAVVSNSQLQSAPSMGRVVHGVAADGSAQLVVRVQGQNLAGHSLSLQLINDQGSQSTSSSSDGALASPGTPSLSITQSQVTIVAGSADGSGVAYAFGVYRPPVDFVRPSTASDTSLASRGVSVEVVDVTAGNVTLATVPIAILRPPVVLIHGLWSDWKGWNNFSPLVTGKNSQDPRFYVGRVNYANKVSGIASTNPTVAASQLTQIRGNSLGLQYNAQGVADQIGALLNDFKNGNNPLNIPVAGVEVDIVGHSLGGLMARQLVLGNAFIDPSNFLLGYIHKLITVDSPHLGSPLAAQLLSSNSPCIRGYLADFGDYSLISATPSNGNPINGAVGDLQGNGIGVDSSLSPALTTLAAPGPLALPSALVAGIYTNWNSLNCFSCVSGRIRAKCPNDPLAQDLTSDSWPGLFTNATNDGIVGVTSQLNGAATSSLQFSGVAHTPGIVGTFGLGFAAPSVLDSATATPPNPIAGQVVTLLNTSVTQPPFSVALINP